MKKTTVAVAVVATVVVVGGVALARQRSQPTTTPTEASSTSVEPASLEQQFAAYKGEDYDRQYLANMIEHHNGAIDMAEQALTSASHQQLKDLATAIVTAQRSEVERMGAWQQQWS
jgi:uncharacterized protein (DUF305 family)